MDAASYQNPFRPGAGHMPPYLAGRVEEQEQFQRLLEQRVILENLVLTGLRGVGKTVLAETFKPIALRSGWMWVGTDLSESTSVSEEMIARRVITDLSIMTSGLTVSESVKPGLGFAASDTTERTTLGYDALTALFDRTPGLIADKLKYVLELSWAALGSVGVRGVVFAYDEAQNMSDRPAKEQYPLSLLLDVFQSIQRKNIPFMLALTGLPTLFPKLVEARTFAERMFRVVVLLQLGADDSRDAITKPIGDASCPVKLSTESIELIVKESAGYPYFIQFICKEVYDAFLQRIATGNKPSVPMDEITSKLDADFFAGRWARATDRQRDLLWVVARLDSCEEEFTVQEVVRLSREVLDRGFSSSHVNQMLAALINSGLVYKNRHGRYSLAVPLFGAFVRRQGDRR